MEVLKARQEQIGADLAKIERNVRALVARELECWRVGRWGMWPGLAAVRTSP